MSNRMPKAWSWYRADDVWTDWAVGEIARNAYMETLRRRREDFWKDAREVFGYDKALSESQVATLEAFAGSLESVECSQLFQRFGELWGFVRELRAGEESK